MLTANQYYEFNSPIMFIDGLLWPYYSYSEEQTTA